MVAPEWVVQRPHSASEWGAANRSHGIFKGRHFEATLILQAVSWYLRYPLSYRDIEELFLERGLEVDHSTLNRWVLAYAPLIERRLISAPAPDPMGLLGDCPSVRPGLQVEARFASRAQRLALPRPPLQDWREICAWRPRSFPPSALRAASRSPSRAR